MISRDNVDGIIITSDLTSGLSEDFEVRIYVILYFNGPIVVKSVLN